MPHAEINNLNLYYETSGSGKPVLLIGGLACDHRIWGYQTGSLSRCFTVITFDQRGIGRSSGYTEDFTFSNLAFDARSLLDMLGYERACIVGMSMGGVVAQKLAVDYPGVVERLALVSTHAHANSVTRRKINELRLSLQADGPEAFAKELINLTFTKAYRQEHPEKVNATASLLAENAQRNKTVLHQMALLTEFDFREELRRLRMPVLAIAGEGDRLVPPKCSVEIAELIPDCNLEIIAGGGHGISAELWREFNETLLGFLQ